MEKFGKISKKKISLLIIFLCISLMSITVGFSAMTTTLSINGSAKFKPVDMIRVTGIEQNKLQGSEEISAKYTYNSINVLVDINDNDGYAMYDVTISNLGEVDKELAEIEKEIFSNENMEYELIGLEIGDVIRAKETVNFKVKFKNKNNQNLSSENRLNAKLKFIFDDYVFVPTDYQIVFDANGGSGSMNSIDVTYDSEITLPENTFTNGDLIFSHWNTKADDSGKSYDDKQAVKNINTDNPNKVTLYAQWRTSSTAILHYDDCTFNGPNSEASGDCSVDNSYDFVNTNISLFSDENYSKNFVLSLVLTELDESRMGTGKRDTFFSAMYEENDSIKGKFPGVLLRVENNKIVLHASNGQQTSTYATDIWFDREDFINKDFKLVRYNDGETIKLYYMLGDSEPHLVKDITDLYATFDNPLFFGAMVKPDNTTSERQAIGKIEDVNFDFIDDETAKELLGIEDEPDDPDDPDEPEIPTETFSIVEACTFNGANGTISGCESDKNYIDTNINLWSEENYKKDFDVSFTIDEYVPGNQESTQVTLMNAFREVSPKGYGMLVRRTGNNFEIIMRDGHGTEKTIKPASSTTQTIRFVRKNNNLCYSINGGTMTFAISLSKFDGPFDVPITFGAGIDKDGNPFRHIKGTLSNMNVTLGKIDSSITCSP